jgi:acyl-CoA thioesterase I
MKPFLVALLPAFVLITLGCNPSAGRPAVVVFLGDSVTSNWSASWAGTTFTGHSTWINKGIVGQNSNQLRARFQTDVATFHPQMVVILTGTNDVYPGWRGPCITSMVPLVFLNKTNTCENIKAMVTMAVQAGIRPILATIPPWNCPNRTQCALAERADPGPSRYQRIDQLNAWIQQYGAEQGLEVVDYHSALVRPDGEQYQCSLTVDGVHPNPAGYAVMAPLVEGAITADQMK